jgi:hypothetical protein
MSQHKQGGDVIYRSGQVPKVIIEFDLPEEQGDFEAATHGREALSVLWDIDQHCRALLKHGNPDPAEASLAEHIREMIPFHLTEM